jgi:hypothetical protein
MDWLSAQLLYPLAGSGTTLFHINTKKGELSVRLCLGGE